MQKYYCKVYFNDESSCRQGIFPGQLLIFMPPYFVMPASSMENHFITFKPSGRRGRIMPGDTIFSVMKRCGLVPVSLCDGKRICGRCRVRVEKDGLPDRKVYDPEYISARTARERTVLNGRELAEGWRIACAARPYADVTVWLPELPRPRLIPTASGEKLPAFECNHAGSEEVPPEVIRKFGVRYWDAYQLGPVMSAAAALIADTCSDPVCKLPFCVTIEAGAFGAEIKFPDSGRLPTPGRYLFENAEDLAGLQDIDFSRGRIHEVLESVRLLHEVGRRIVLKVEAPFTVLTMLMEPVRVYKNLRHHRDVMEQALAKIRRNLVEYIRRAFAMGADIISYADPSGVVEFVGPKTFKEFSGHQTVLLLREVQQLSGGGIVHLCGKTSTSLEYMGMAHSRHCVLPGTMNFAQALFQVYERDRIVVTGHNCILVTAEPVEHQEIYFMDV